jgi:hypothetical protein
MSLGSPDGANTDQTDHLYYVPVSAQYPYLSFTSKSESTYPTNNLGTSGPANYVLLPGMGVSVHLTPEYMLSDPYSNSNQPR